jgi:AcrR family transcriptional regulator
VTDLHGTDGASTTPGRPPRRRGRPPKAPPASDRPPGLSVSDPLAALPPAARRILVNAQRLVIERGFHALTIESVALESGETPHTVLRHFGSKAGLVESVMDAAAHDAYVRLVSSVGDLAPGRERAAAYIEGLSSLAKDTEAAVLIFRIAPHALVDPALRTRAAALYSWYRELTVREAGLSPDATPDLPEEERLRLQRLGAVIVAAVDGLSLQAGLDPAFDADAAFAELARLVTSAL